MKWSSPSSGAFCATESGYAMVAEVEALLRDQVVVPRPPHPAAVEIRDPADRWILASVIAGHAEVLVSGDSDLLALRGRVPLSITSPRQFWEMVRGGKE